MPSAVARTGVPRSAEMSRPGWKSGSPVNGSCRLPKPDDSQPATGQIDGVARASACWLSTCDFTEASRFSSAPSRSRRMPNVLSGDFGDRERDGDRQRRRRPRPRASARRQAVGEGLLAWPGRARPARSARSAPSAARKSGRSARRSPRDSSRFRAAGSRWRPERFELALVRATRPRARPGTENRHRDDLARPLARTAAGDRQPPDGSRFSVRDENCVTR